MREVLSLKVALMWCVGNPPWDSIFKLEGILGQTTYPLFRALGKQDALQAARELCTEPEIDLRWRKYINKQINKTIF